MSDAAKQIEREFDRLCKSSPMFREFVEFCPENTMEQSIESWAWVTKLVENAVRRTIRDLTGPPAAPKLNQKKDR